MKLNTLSPIALLFVGLLCAGFGYANPPKQCYADTKSAYQALISTQKSKRLNINTASQADFIQSLMNVKGIGPAILNKNRHRLSVAN